MVEALPPYGTKKPPPERRTAARVEFIYSGWILTSGKGSKKQKDGKEDARPTLQTKRANRFETLCHNVDTLQRAAVRLVQTIPRYERPKRPRPFQVLKYARPYLVNVKETRAKFRGARLIRLVLSLHVCKCLLSLI